MSGKELHKQLDEVTQDAEIIAIRQKEAECELEATRDRVQQQATEILLKASQIGSLQATQMTHEAAIRDLESEKSRLKDKVIRLEEERGALQNKSHALDERQRQQILSLEKDVRIVNEFFNQVPKLLHMTTLREEKQGYEKDLMSLRSKYEEDTAHFKEAQSRALDELSKKHRAALESIQTSSEKEKNRLLTELEQQFERERSSLEEQKKRLREQLDTLREELTAKLNMANNEVSRLQELVKEGEQGMGSAKGHISSLKEAQEKLLEELDATRARLRETTNLLTALQGEMETQKQQHEAKLISTKEEEKLKMDKMALELELKWTETLRQECKKLREELREEHEEDKRAALTQLAQNKEQELGTARESWQRKVEDLLEQISLLKQSLEMQLSQSQHSLQQLQAQFSQEREHLGQQLQELELEHQRREERLREAHCCAIQDMQEARQHDLKQQMSYRLRVYLYKVDSKELEERLRQHHHMELQSLREVHRQNIETLKQQSEQELQTLRFELEDEGKAMLASLRSELNHLHASAIEHLRQSHQQETAAAKQELENALEQSRIQSSANGDGTNRMTHGGLAKFGIVAVGSDHEVTQKGGRSSCDECHLCFGGIVVSAKMNGLFQCHSTSTPTASAGTERELLSRISDLQEEVTRRKNHIADLDHEIHTLNENISTLTKELELKGKEVLKIRSEANQQIRAHEQDLCKKHEREMVELNGLHNRETQNMLSDFNKAQELLKDKISALQILLEATEDKFRNRESRPEDLQMIAELKEMVTERETLVKKLVDDKKFYQLELVNRETNFNKVFNASPNVGVINPLIKQKRKNDKSANRFSSSPNLRANVEASGTGSGQPQPSRLEPIPNSPIHQLELNTSKPLPPPTPPTEPKKFMSPPETEESPVASPDPQRQEWFAQYFTF
ncbi:hypothetical protein NFI96_024784 [Prochilodus magdalenae]|nr:hypothetical protein NFI96_024784 [Prochilodus magdalenae]